ncbi:S-layer homology domain-containing protein [Demequina activiva]|uniref:SLH domain-containing protein n=1 Tax=Demequina activiva TaxID=1582364 RepID=A0A919ULG8_9MICO|nr:S-layer homology domain-containing protein [Demequina activiva]GIG54703.1 hypothetical protein Dac01nite_14550 [Demequina activiva]
MSVPSTQRRRSLRLIATAALAAVVAAVGATAPAAAASTFPDVPDSHPFQEHISWLADTGVTYGYSNGDFGPADTVRRGQMAAFLYKVAGSPEWTPPASSPFSDVSTTNVFYKHITWLAAEGITSGVGDGSRFAPNGTVTRGQMAVFLYKMAGSPAHSAPSTARFSDVPTSATIYPHVDWLADTGITSGVGDGSRFAPGSPVKRGQMAVFLYKYYFGFEPWGEATYLSCEYEVVLYNAPPEATSAIAYVYYTNGSVSDIQPLWLERDGDVLVNSGFAGVDAFTGVEFTYSTPTAPEVAVLYGHVETSANPCAG